jgi:xanthine dehydrogenase accessory factor
MPATATDPVCGMEVVAAEATVHLDDDGGGRVYFCCEGCRSTYAADPVRRAAD